MFNKNDLSSISKYLKDREETIAVAESVSSGFLQAAISQADGASEFFQGGITVYNVGQKARHLHIDPIHGIACNCVSERIARQMAIEVCNLFSSDWGIGITGYATRVKELGKQDLFSYYSFAYKGQVVQTGKLTSKKKSPSLVQQDYVNKILNDLSRRLSLLNK